MLPKQNTVFFAIIILALILLAAGALLIGEKAGKTTPPALPTPTTTLSLPGEGSSVQLGTFLPPTPTPTL